MNRTGRLIVMYTRALFFALGVVGAVALSMPGMPPSGVLGGFLVVAASIGLTLVVEYLIRPIRRVTARPVRDRQRSAGAPTA